MSNAFAAEGSTLKVCDAFVGGDVFVAGQVTYLWKVMHLWQTN